MKAKTLWSYVLMTLLTATAAQAQAELDQLFNQVPLVKTPKGSTIQINKTFLLSKTWSGTVMRPTGRNKQGEDLGLACTLSTVVYDFMFHDYVGRGILRPRSFLISGVQRTYDNVVQFAFHDDDDVDYGFVLDCYAGADKALEDYTIADLNQAAAGVVVIIPKYSKL